MNSDTKWVRKTTAVIVIIYIYHPLGTDRISNCRYLSQNRVKRIIEQWGDHFGSIVYFFFTFLFLFKFYCLNIDTNLFHSGRGIGSLNDHDKGKITTLY